MKSLNKQEGSGGIGFLGLLCILFIALKLTEVITWSWWLVFAPLWGGFALVFGGAAIVGLFALIVSLATSNKFRK